MEALVIVLKILLALLFTIVIEGAILYLFKEKNKKVYLVMILMNILTNVPLNLVTLLVFDGLNTFTVFVVPCIEIVIALLETFGYYLYTTDKKKSFIYGIFCNAYSYILGGLICWIIFTILSLGF